MSDLIDRYEVIELLKKMRYETDSKWVREMITTVEDKINAMPSAEPIIHIKYAAISQLKELGYESEEKPKKGEWIDAQYPYSKCSICEGYFDTENNVGNFCPNCGADMRGEQDE